MPVTKKRPRILKFPEEVVIEPPPQKRLFLIIEVIVFLIVAVALARWAQFIEPERLIARDSLYHVGHASVYATRGIFYHDFPWPTYSVIRVFAADIWYGFHVLLIPFALLHYEPEHQVNQVKWAGTFLTASLLVLVYFALRRGTIAFPWAWPFVMVVACMFRYAQVRPQLLTTGLTALLFAFLVTGSAWAVFAIVAVLAFLHLAFFWLAIFTAIVVVGVKWAVEKTFEWKKLVATFAGLVVGWLLRPNPIGAAKILWVQIFQLVMQKQKGETPLSFGIELSPINSTYLAHSQGAYLIVWMVLAVALLLVVLAGFVVGRQRIPSRRQTWLWSSLGLSVIFFLMTLFQYMRSLDHWTLFSALFMAAAVSCLVRMKSGLRERLAKLPQATAVPAYAAFIVVAVGVFILIAYQSLSGRYGFIGAMAKSMHPYRYRQAGAWLSTHTPAKSIVFHSNWGIFPELFFWDKHNRYIGGMDPMFQYTYSKDLYWKSDNIHNGVGAPDTWGTGNPKGSQHVDMFTSLRRDFHASYILLEKSDPGTPQSVLEYVQNDPRFIWRYEDNESQILELVDKPER